MTNALAVIKGDNSGIVCHTEVTFWHDLSGESSGTGLFVLLRLDLVRGEEQGADGPIADSEIRSDLLEALALLPQLHNLCSVHRSLWAAQLLTVCPGISNPGSHPFSYQLALKLRHC